MKVDIMPKEAMVALTRNSGETLRVSLPEFWEIVRAGERFDTREEIENYLADGGTFEGIDSETIRGNEAFLDEVAEKLIESRVSNEHGDQVYEAICFCVKQGKHRDELFVEKSLADMDVEDFKKPERRREFNGLMHAYRDLKRRMDEQNGMPFGGDRNMQDSLKLRLGHVTTAMDLLRVKEWLSKQPYDLDTDSPQYKEAMEMLEEVCGWSFPELASMVFDGGDNDLIFKTLNEQKEYLLYCYNPAAVSGGQLFAVVFDENEARRIADAEEPIHVVADNREWMLDMGTKPFLLGILQMLEMKEEGCYLGDNIEDVCREIVGEKSEVSRDDVKQRIFESFQEGRSTYELSGWERGTVVVYCDCDLFMDSKVHFTTEKSKFFYDMENEGQAPAHEHIADILASHVMSGELQWREEGARSASQVCTWHGDVDVPYGFPGLDEIDYDSMELAAEGLLSKRLASVGLFENICLEKNGKYKDGVGYSFSFTANVDERVAGPLLQTALEGLRFGACSEVQRSDHVGELIDNATARADKVDRGGEKKVMEL